MCIYIYIYTHICGITQFSPHHKPQTMPAAYCATYRVTCFVIHRCARQPLDAVLCMCMCRAVVSI